MTDKNSPTESRFSGFLTPTDKKFLQGEKEYDGDSNRRDAEYRARMRTLEAIRDFSFINTHLPDKNLREISEKVFEEDTDHLVRALSNFYSIIDILSSKHFPAQETDEVLANLLETSILREELRKGRLSEIEATVDIHPEEPNVDKLIKRALEDGITRNEIAYLQWKNNYVDLLKDIVESDTYIEIEMENSENSSLTPVQAEQILEEMEEENDS